MRWRRGDEAEVYELPSALVAVGMVLGIRSVQGRTADALALGGDEGRGKLR